MSFCCGASMIGTKGTLKHMTTHIHNVPITFCPVCHGIDVHYKAQSEYDILAEYAYGDGAAEVDFEDYVDQDQASLLENCVNHENEEPMDVVRSQIDMALDLLSFANHLDDKEWQYMLKKRLQVLGSRRNKLLQRKSSV